MMNSIGSMASSFMQGLQANNSQRMDAGRKKPETDADYQQLLDKLTGNKDTDAIASKIYDKLDVDSDGDVTLEEFKNGKPQRGENGPPPMPGTGGMDRAMFEFKQSSETGQAGPLPPPPSQSGVSESDDPTTYDPDDLNQDGIVDLAEMMQAMKKEKQSNVARAYDNYSLLAS